MTLLIKILKTAKLAQQNELDKAQKIAQKTGVPVRGYPSSVLDYALSDLLSETVTQRDQ